MVLHMADGPHAAHGPASWPTTGSTAMQGVIGKHLQILKVAGDIVWGLPLMRTDMTLLCRWAVMNFAPGGDTYFTCVVNSSVHVAM